jgi:hypothetical protein
MTTSATADASNQTSAGLWRSGFLENCRTRITVTVNHIAPANATSPRTHMMTGIGLERLMIMILHAMKICMGVEMRTVMTGSITFVDARVNQEGSCEKMRDDKPAASIHGKNWVADGKAYSSTNG